VTSANQQDTSAQNERLIFITIKNRQKGRNKINNNYKHLA